MNVGRIVYSDIDKSLALEALTERCESVAALAERIAEGSTDHDEEAVLLALIDAMRIDADRAVHILSLLKSPTPPPPPASTTAKTRNRFQ